jgi:hypothetical protein
MNMRKWLPEVWSLWAAVAAGLACGCAGPRGTGKTLHVDNPIVSAVKNTESGLAIQKTVEYFNLDPWVGRLAMVLSGGMVLACIVAVISVTLWILKNRGKFKRHKVRDAGGSGIGRRRKL